MNKNTQNFDKYNIVGLSLVNLIKSNVNNMEIIDTLEKAGKTSLF